MTGAGLCVVTGEDHTALVLGYLCTRTLPLYNLIFRYLASPYGVTRARSIDYMLQCSMEGQCVGETN